MHFWNNFNTTSRDHLTTDAQDHLTHDLYAHIRDVLLAVQKMQQWAIKQHARKV